MGYESRVIVANRIEKKGNREDKPFVYVEPIADIKMGVMDQGFVDLFDKDVNYKVYIDSENEPTETDRYGNGLTYTDCKTVISYLEGLLAKGENYRRLSMLYGLLKGINEEQWDEIHIIHYGY